MFSISDDDGRADGGLASDDGTRARARATRGETSQKILDAAEALFAVRSPKDVTVRDVAERAGVTHALVHQYFGTKDDLLNAVIARVQSDRMAIVQRSQTLKEAGESLADDILNNRLYSRALVRSAMDGVEYVSLDVRIRTGAALSELARETARSAGVARPQLMPSDIDTNVAIAAAAAMLFGWSATEDWLYPIFGIDPEDSENVYRQIREIVGCLMDLALLSDAEAEPEG